MSTLRLAADYESARAIGAWLQETLTSDAAQQGRAGELELAIHEVAINIVDHAFEGETVRRHYTISLVENTASGEVTVQFHDDGVPFAGAAAPSLSEPQVGGYGLFIAEQLASTLSYERVADTNIWTLVFAPATTTDSQP